MEKIKIIEKTDENYPKSLLELDDAPKKLYVIGNEKILNNRAIAIVGSRNCSEYGERYATKFARELSKAGICVISGLAVGIDTAAHKGAKSYKGKTIAVLGGGLNNIYPPENIGLVNDIIKNGGCVISEHEPDKKPILSEFPKRNRIISGISEGVLVVEALHRSGSSVTAKYAYEQGRKVFCIPSNLGVKTGVGTNILIQKGALLVMKPNDILEQLNIFINDGKDEEDDEDEEINIEDEYKDIYKLLKNKPLNINAIAKSLNKSIVEINQKLGMMEICGYVKCIPGNNYIIV